MKENKQRNIVNYLDSYLVGDTELWVRKWAFVKRGEIKPLHNEPGPQDWCISSLAPLSVALVRFSSSSLSLT